MADHGINNRNWLTVFMYHVMTKHTPNGDNWKKVFGMSDKTDVDVKVLIDNVEVSFESFIKMLEEHHDNMVKEEAKELIDSSFSKVIDTLTEMSEMAQHKLQDDVLPSWRK